MVRVALRPVRSQARAAPDKVNAAPREVALHPPEGVRLAPSPEAMPRRALRGACNAADRSLAAAPGRATVSQPGGGQWPTVVWERATEPRPPRLAARGRPAAPGPRQARPAAVLTGGRAQDRGSPPGCRAGARPGRTAVRVRDPLRSRPAPWQVDGPRPSSVVRTALVRVPRRRAAAMLRHPARTVSPAPPRATGRTAARKRSADPFAQQVGQQARRQRIGQKRRQRAVPEGRPLGSAHVVLAPRRLTAARHRPPPAGTRQHEGAARRRPSLVTAALPGLQRLPTARVQ